MGFGLRNAFARSLGFLRRVERVAYRLLQTDDGPQDHMPDGLKRDLGYSDGRPCRSRRGEIRDARAVWSKVCSPRGPQ